MKKSNALMLSYIIFLGIAVIAHIFTPWEGIEQISIAATIASVFFAFSDLNNWRVSSNLLKAENVREEVLAHIDFCKTSLGTEEKKVQEVKEALNLLRPYENSNERAKRALAESQLFLEQLEHNLEEMRKIVDKGDDHIKKANEIVDMAKGMRNWEYLFAVCGFISFFVLVTFDKLASILRPYGAVLTVIAFLIIVLTYYLRDDLNDKGKQMEEDLAKQISEQREKMSQHEKELDALPFIDAAKKVVERIKEDMQVSEANIDGQTENAQP